MGIPGLRKFLTENEVIQYKSKFPDNVNTIAIDAMFIIHKYLHSNNEEVLYSVLNQILKFLIAGIVPIYVIDGKSPIEKKNLLKKRKKKKMKYFDKLQELKLQLYKEPSNISIKKKILKLKKLCKNVSSTLIQNFKNLLDILNIKYIIAEGEADYTCCKLCQMNIVDACLSEDMDFLTLGCNQLFYFQKNKNNKTICQINLNDILKKTNLNKLQFTYFCLILGNDYNINTVRIDANDIYMNITKYNNIQNWIDNESNFDIKSYLESVLYNYQIIFNMYNNIKINKFKINKKIIINLKQLQNFFDSIIKPNSYKYHYTNKICKLINIINYESLLYSNIY
jgi:5'-3' exonuclease